MAKPSSRQELIDYSLRRLGAPVLEINVDDDQIDDLVDDALQVFNERHFDGVERMYLKYKFTAEDINRGKATNETGSSNTLGIVTTSGISLYCPNKNIGSKSSTDNRFIILSPQIYQCDTVSF